jgi:hypothetical protein
MSIAQMIHNEIAKFPLGEPFTVERLKQYGNWKTVQRSLSRMTQSGEINRISKGIYAKPEMFKGHKIVMTGKQLIDCIESVTHEAVVPGGAHATNILGISTQAQVAEMYYWTGRSKTINIEGQIVVLRYIGKKFVNKSHPLLELFLSSAYYLGNKLFTVESLKLAEKRLGREKILELKIYLPLMPTWVMLVFQEYFAGLQ